MSLNIFDRVRFDIAGPDGIVVMLMFRAGISQ